MKTPILFLIFNRPDVTKRVFEAIRRAKPDRLYIAADGARDSKAGEKELCDEARKVVKMVDWDCKVYKLFREKNMGCRLAVSSAIDWFFDQEEEGIILEDDCLPDPSFFIFCEQLLDHYRHDTRIGHISGGNFQHGIKRGSGSYYYSRYPHIWGWASWKRAWKKYDLAMSDYPYFASTNQLKNVFKTKAEQEYWKSIYDDTFSKFPTTWDYQWVYALTKENMLAILPQVNLVKNIGFGNNATHTTKSSNPFDNIPLESMKEEIMHPQVMLPDTEADFYTYTFFFKASGLVVLKRAAVNFLSACLSVVNKKKSFS